MQISERALEVWESEEAIEEEREKRLENKQKVKVKKFDKRMKGKCRFSFLMVNFKNK